MHSSLLTNNEKILLRKGFGHEVNYYQCTTCGAIVSLENELMLESDIYADLYCNKCGKSKALYLCDKQEDLYIYADSFLDKRYFNN